MVDKNSEEIVNCARKACELEASAEKPGNVTPSKSFDNMSYKDFVDSAKTLEQFIETAAVEGENSEIGKLIYEATSKEKNVNFGIIIMFMPLAATRGNSTKKIIGSLTPHDTKWIVQAMQKGKLGGMGLKDESLGKYDIMSKEIFNVIDEEEITPLKLMEMSQPYDTLAKEWVNDYPISRAIAERISTDEYSIVNEYLLILSLYPDTLIARKAGIDESRKVSQMARQVLDGVISKEKFDSYLRADGNILNPGTTADLIATGLFLKLAD